MLPLQPWLAAMAIEANLPPRPARYRAERTADGGLRALVGRGLIGLGNFVAGIDGAKRPATASR
jgi:hypothetical protein